VTKGFLKEGRGMVEQGILRSQKCVSGRQACIMHACISSGDIGWLEVVHPFHKLMRRAKQIYA
jgi:hypothetical protein